MRTHAEGDTRTELSQLCGWHRVVGWICISPVNSIGNWSRAIIEWLGVVIVVVWVLDVVFPRVSWKLEVFFAHVKHRTRGHMPKWRVARHRHGSDGVLDLHNPSIELPLSF